MGKAGADEFVLQGGIHNLRHEQSKTKVAMRQVWEIQVRIRVLFSSRNDKAVKTIEPVDWVVLGRL